MRNFSLHAISREVAEICHSKHRNQILPELIDQVFELFVADEVPENRRISALILGHLQTEKLLDAKLATQIYDVLKEEAVELLISASPKVTAPVVHASQLQEAMAAALGVLAPFFEFSDEVIEEFVQPIDLVLFPHCMALYTPPIFFTTLLSLYVAHLPCTYRNRLRIAALHPALSNRMRQPDIHPAVREQISLFWAKWYPTAPDPLILQCFNHSLFNGYPLKRLEWLQTRPRTLALPSSTSSTYSSSFPSISSSSSVSSSSPSSTAPSITWIDPRSRSLQAPTAEQIMNAIKRCAAAVRTSTGADGSKGAIADRLSGSDGGRASPVVVLSEADQAARRVLLNLLELSEQFGWAQAADWQHIAPAIQDAEFFSDFLPEQYDLTFRQGHRPLQFDFKQPVRELSLHNRSSSHTHAFTIQVSSPDLFTVVPAFGVLEPYATLPIQVRFHHQRLTSARKESAFLRLRSVHGFALERVSLLAISGRTFQILRSSVDFGLVATGSSKSSRVFVKNVGLVACSAFFHLKDSAFFVSPHTCFLKVGETKSVEVTFSPYEPMNSRAKLAITAPGGEQHLVDLRGSSVTPPPSSVTQLVFNTPIHSGGVSPALPVKLLSIASVDETVAFENLPPCLVASRSPEGLFGIALGHPPAGPFYHEFHAHLPGFSPWKFAIAAHVGVALQSLSGSVFSFPPSPVGSHHYFTVPILNPTQFSVEFRGSIESFNFFPSSD